MPLDRKAEQFFLKSEVGLDIPLNRTDSSRSTKARPVSARQPGEKDPKASVSSISSLQALGVEFGGDGLTRDDSLKRSGREHGRAERKPKMDVARASGIMGFSSGRWLDKSHGSETDPKKELDKALFTRMQDLLKKKRAFQKEKADRQEAAVSILQSTFLSIVLIKLSRFLRL